MAVPRVPPAGVWCPAVTFFDQYSDTVDLAAQARFFTYLSRSGLTGLVVLGTTSEAFLLTREERAQVIKTARDAVGPDFPLMAGVGGHSTKQVLEHIEDAQQAGANYALVLPAAYFGKATTRSVISTFYDYISCTSPLPVVIYNFPAVCNGIDMDSEHITEMALRDPNIVGVKLSCGSAGKIPRLAAELLPEDFSIFAGQSDFLIAGLSVGSAGCIAAFANVFPKTVAKIYELYKAGQIKEALELHQKAALAKSPCKYGIATTKYAAALYAAKAAGIDDAEVKLLPRRPYEPPTGEQKEDVRSMMAEIAGIEAGL
ncbi:hypothetical protein LOZ36_006692 [Ophidiomyces ophidiicola]|nr:hypothetical protein LOZ36_006692 [Ophidiomyces ophidiicola]